MMGNKTAVKYGLIAGIGTVAYFLLFYFISTRLMFSPWVYWASLGIYLALMWKALQDEKQDAAGPLAFKDGLRTAFLIFVIANVCYYLFYYLLFGLIDPDLIALQKTVMLESLQQAGSLLPPEQQQEMRRSLESGALAVTPGSVFFTFVRSLIGGFILSAGMAVVVARQ
ncbi:MAG: DUF4199 domain-containing protein [Phaeodactylibacter sp.]|nr:DUF4199 domain-containing protein [Phaeodactylibacter sp.]MCB9301612.1 DUF4199 domain-containing protein [Lewinellaceae bacterium]HQU59746.1 DUF4199 domain-containing protein [Saprospiraceae bacterium]